MRRKNRTEGPSRGVLAAIGAVASVVLLVIGGLLVASGAGSLSRDPQVTATVPAEAGLIQGAAGVQYQAYTSVPSSVSMRGSPALA